MTDSVDPSGLGRVLSKTMSALGRVTGLPEDGVPAEGVGQAADGMIVVTVAPPGKITALTLDPRVMRMASETLAEQITVAVNAALADLRRTAPAAGPAKRGGLGDTLRRIQEDTSRRITAFTDALGETPDRLAARGGR